MKTAVITGVSGGIGRATAMEFLKHGWRVIGTFYSNSAPSSMSSLVSVALDLSLPQNIALAADEIKKIAPNIDVLVNNAGVLLDAADQKIDLVKVRKTFEVNLFGLMDLTERLLPLLPSGGQIINLDSGYGAFSDPIDDATAEGYRISKAALNMYTRILAFRTKEAGIIVSSIAPGWVKTNMGYSIASATEQPDRTPEDAARDIYQLAVSDPASGLFWEYGKVRPW